MNKKARFSGRQKMAALCLSPAKAGWEIILGTVPRAALRFTSFRCACPGLNSVAGDAGSLSSSFRDVLWISAFSLILLFFTACSKSNQQSPNAQLPTVSKVTSSADVVKVSAPNISITAGANVDATVILSIAPGYHINANPATFPYLIATEVQPYGELDDMLPLIGKAVYPAPVMKKFAFAEEPLAVYESEVGVKLPIRMPSLGKTSQQTAKELVSIPISVRVQACDQEKCFPPDTLHTIIVVEVK